MFRLTKDTTVGDLLSVYPGLVHVLQGIGLHCLGCPSAQMETIEQAANVHGIDVDDLLEDLRGFMQEM